MSFSRRAWLVIFLLLVVIGGLAWQTPPQWPVQLDPVRVEEPWQIAPSREADLKPSLGYLATTTMWGKVEVAKAENEQPDPAWRFMGLMSVGTEKMVMIAVEKQPDRQLRKGDTLPGGAKILEIHADSLCVNIEGKHRRLPLYQQSRQAQ